MDIFKLASETDFAFQPIVYIESGDVYGYELLLRHDSNKFSIPGFFDAAFDESNLHKVDLLLRKKAFAKIRKIPFYKEKVFFYNLDNRLFLDEDYKEGKTEIILDSVGLPKDNICFEVSERHEIRKKQHCHDLFVSYKNRSFMVAIDDYGSGHSGLKTLYNFEPDFIKIDRFLIQNLFYDPKKRLFVTSLVNMANKMGVKVIAEGVETEDEFLGCQECGCDFVQGYFIQRPTRSIDELRKKYDI